MGLSGGSEAVDDGLVYEGPALLDETGTLGGSGEPQRTCRSSFWYSAYSARGSGSIDGDRGNREPGMVIEGLRRKARGSGGGEGDSDRSDADNSRYVLSMVSL